MQVNQFLNSLPSHQKDLLQSIHQTIITTDSTITPEVGKMMGQQMVLYKDHGIFKYGLSPGKSYMSLHLMPIYGSPNLHARYKALLSNAKFQKGCINFKSADEMPLPVVQQLLTDCAAVNMRLLMEQYKAKRKTK